MSIERMTTIADFIRVAMNSEQPDLNEGLQSLKKRIPQGDRASLPELSLVQPIFILLVLTEFDRIQLYSLFSDLAAEFGNYSVSSEQFNTYI